MRRGYIVSNIRRGITAVVVGFACIVAVSGASQTTAAAQGAGVPTPKNSTLQTESTTPQVDAASVAQELHVTAKVVPMRRVIVDNLGHIMQIMSNTASPVPPTVFVGSDLPSHQIPLTAAIAAEYAALLPPDAGIGMLYTRTVAITSSATVSSARPGLIAVRTALGLSQPLRTAL